MQVETWRGWGRPQPRAGWPSSCSVPASAPTPLLLRWEHLWSAQGIPVDLGGLPASRSAPGSKSVSGTGGPACVCKNPDTQTRRQGGAWARNHLAECSSPSQHTHLGVFSADLICPVLTQASRGQEATRHGLGTWRTRPLTSHDAPVRPDGSSSFTPAHLSLGVTSSDARGGV